MNGYVALKRSVRPPLSDDVGITKTIILVIFITWYFKLFVENKTFVR